MDLGRLKGFSKAAFLVSFFELLGEKTGSLDFSIF
jgi:hypothetical protein